MPIIITTFMFARMAQKNSGNSYTIVNRSRTGPSPGINDSCIGLQFVCWRANISPMLSFIRYQPVGLRIWHWLNATVITGLLLTVGLRRTLFSMRKNGAFFIHDAEESGVKLDPHLAKDLARGLVDRFWSFHIWLGFALGLLLLLRLVLAFSGEESPWGMTLRSLSQFRASSPDTRKDSLHFLLARSGYLAFYLAILLQALTGLTMTFNYIWKFSDETMDRVHDVHETFQWFFLAFVVLHIVGVVLAELSKHRGIVSNMIHGGNR